MLGTFQDSAFLTSFEHREGVREVKINTSISPTCTVHGPHHRVRDFGQPPARSEDNSMRQHDSVTSTQLCPWRRIIGCSTFVVTCTASKGTSVGVVVSCVSALPRGGDIERLTKVTVMAGQGPSGVEVVGGQDRNFDRAQVPCLSSWGLARLAQ